MFKIFKKNKIISVLWLYWKIRWMPMDLGWWKQGKWKSLDLEGACAWWGLPSTWGKSWIHSLLLWVTSASEWRRQCFTNPIEWLRWWHGIMQVRGMAHSRHLLEVAVTVCRHGRSKSDFIFKFSLQFVKYIII